jgi:hypothetical protein
MAGYADHMHRQQARQTSTSSWDNVQQPAQSFASWQILMAQAHLQSEALVSNQLRIDDTAICRNCERPDTQLLQTQRHSSLQMCRNSAPQLEPTLSPKPLLEISCALMGWSAPNGVHIHQSQ